MIPDFSCSGHPEDPPSEFYAEFSFAIENFRKNLQLRRKKNEIIEKSKTLTIYHNSRDINILNTQPCGLMGICVSKHKMHFGS